MKHEGQKFVDKILGIDPNTCENSQAIRGVQKAIQQMGREAAEECADLAEWTKETFVAEISQMLLASLLAKIQLGTEEPDLLIAAFVVGVSSFKEYAESNGHNFYDLFK